MKIKALVSFSGALSMAAGEVRDCEDRAVLDDLLQAGYVEPVEKAEKPSGKKKAVKTGEDK